MTLKQFFKKYNTTVIKLKKKGGKKHYLLWWETGFDCFINKQFTNSNIPNYNESTFICKRDTDNFITYFINKGYDIIDTIDNTIIEIK